MTRFFRKVCYLLIPFMSIALYLEYKLAQYPNSYNTQKNIAVSYLNTTECIVLGPSHAQNGINPRYLSQPTFNFAIASQSLYYDKAILELYLDKLPKLKTVIITLSYFSLWYQLEDSPEEWRKYLYYQDLDIQNTTINKLESKAWSKIMLYTPKEVINIVKDNFRKEESRYYKGWMGSDTTSQELDSLAGIKRCNFHHGLMFRKHLSKNTEYLEAMIKTLHKRNIKVILLQIPVYDTYSKAMLPSYLKASDSIVQNLTMKYLVPYYNYSSNHFYKRADFHNHDHLNFVGAEKFSKLVDSLIMHQR